jgi:membrane protease YdiL (CAAX protease family)
MRAGACGNPKPFLTKPRRGIQEAVPLPANEDSIIDPLDPLAVRLWRRIPVILRAALIAEILNDVGNLPPGGFMLANLKLWPSVPWLLPATALWLWLFWRWTNGAGWPRSTSESRRRDLRARSLSGRVWRWSLLAGGLGLVSVMGFALLLARLANVSRDAYKLPVDFSTLPPWTVISLLLAISVSAGVVEEAAFRGYLISPIARRHGWPVAILVSGVMFFVAHLNHAYLTLAHLPFFLAVSAVHGLLVYLTGSILPSIVLHATADFLFIPFQYGLIGNLSVEPVWRTGVDSAFLACVAMVVVFGLAAVPAFRRLATVIRGERLPLLPADGGGWEKRAGVMRVLS